jgi:DNA-binding CsgD family transcriptional regulator
VKEKTNGCKECSMLPSLTRGNGTEVLAGLGKCPDLLESGLRMVGYVTYDLSLEKYSLVVTDRREPDDRSSATVQALDEADREIIRMVADGSVSKQIARHLDMSPATAGRRVRQALKKLGKRSRAEAVAHASQVGLLEIVA